MTDLIKIPETITPQQYKAVDLYIQGKDEREICEQIGISPVTLRKWIKTNQNFKSLMRQNLMAFATMGNLKLGSAYERVIEKLVAMLDNPEITAKPKNLFSLAAQIRLFMKNAIDVEKQDETEMSVSETINKSPDGKILSITEQKNILRRIRNGPEQILERKSGDVRNDSAGTTEILQPIATDLVRDTSPD
jgi:transposase-like protein